MSLRGFRRILLYVLPRSGPDPPKREQCLSTHKGVLTQFSALYVKTGELDRSFSLMLANAFAARSKADYEIGVEILENEAAKVVMNTKEFLKMARSLLAHEK